MATYRARAQVMDESLRLRQCLGRFATGVTVVSCKDSRGTPCGITANSFSSVSLAPPMVLWNIAKVSRSLQAYLQAEYFAINILTVQQESLSWHFARSEAELFTGIDYRDSPRDVPLLPDTLAMIECRTQDIHDCGDHHIIVGEVIDYQLSSGEPLLFYSGEYNRFGQPGK